MKTGRRLAGVTASAVVAVILSGCTAEDPAPAPTPSSSSATSPSASSSSPTPEAGTAKEFIRRWVEVGTAMQNSGDTTTYKALVKKCPPCNRLATLIEGFYKDGGFVATKGWTIDRIASIPSPSKTEPIYRVYVNSSPTRYRETRTGPLKRLPGGRTSYRISLVKSANEWRVTDFIEVSQG